LFADAGFRAVKLGHLGWVSANYSLHESAEMVVLVGDRVQFRLDENLWKVPVQIVAEMVDWEAIC